MGASTFITPRRRARDLPLWRRGVVPQLSTRLHLPMLVVREMVAETLQRQLRRTRWSWIWLGIVLIGTVLAFVGGTGQVAVTVLFIGLLVWQLIGHIRARRELVRTAGRKARQLARLRRAARD